MCLYIYTCTVIYIMPFILLYLSPLGFEKKNFHITIHV